MDVRPVGLVRLEKTGRVAGSLAHSDGLGEVYAQMVDFLLVERPMRVLFPLPVRAVADSAGRGPPESGR